MIPIDETLDHASASTSRTVFALRHLQSRLAHLQADLLLNKKPLRASGERIGHKRSFVLEAELLRLTGGDDWISITTRPFVPKAENSKLRGGDDWVSITTTDIFLLQVM
jgi:hypothetical protein